jgi:hypothetical protein
MPGADLVTEVRRRNIKSVPEAEAIRAKLLVGAERTTKWLHDFKGELTELLTALRFKTVGHDPLIPASHDPDARLGLRYRPTPCTAGLGVQILKRQPLGLSLFCWSKPTPSFTCEMQAPQRTHVGVLQDGGGERNMTCDPINWLKL